MRQHPRVRTRGLRVRLSVGNGPLGEATVENLSLGGALAHTEASLPAGAFVVAELLVAGAEPLRLSAQVVGVEKSPPGLRLQWAALDEAKLEVLSRCLEGLGLKRKGAPAPELIPEPPPPPPATEPPAREATRKPRSDRSPRSRPDAQASPLSGPPVLHVVPPDKLLAQIRTLTDQLSEARVTIATQEEEIRRLRTELNDRTPMVTDQDATPH
jgi:hypothetical protein